MQTQFSTKIKVFQSDGGIRFVYHIVKQIFENNGTFHQPSCPYTPQQNGCVERKHRRIGEMGLVMLFHAHVPSSYWFDAFSSTTFIINHLPTKVLKNHSPFNFLYSWKPTYGNFAHFGVLYILTYKIIRNTSSCQEVLLVFSLVIILIQALQMY